MKHKKMNQILEYWKEIIAVAAMVGGYFVGVKKDKFDIFGTKQGLTRFSIYK